MSEIDQIDQNRSAHCNTESSARQGTLAFYWFFTWNNYKIDQIDQIDQILKHECDWFIFQEEKGDEGTPHLQGTLKLKKKKRLTALKKINPAIHWEQTKSITASLAYCSKKETRAGKQWIHNIDIPEEIEISEPYGWQLEVLNIISEKPDKRTIHWFWEPIGNIGKSELCKYLVVKHNALMLTGKSNDMYNMLSKFPSKRKLIICDVPRKSLDYINYSALEQIKNVS